MSIVDDPFEKEIFEFHFLQIIPKVKEFNKEIHHSGIHHFKNAPNM